MLLDNSPTEVVAVGTNDEFIVDNARRRRLGCCINLFDYISNWPVYYEPP